MLVMLVQNCQLELGVLISLYLYVGLPIAHANYEKKALTSSLILFNIIVSRRSCESGHGVRIIVPLWNDTNAVELGRHKAS